MTLDKKPFENMEKEENAGNSIFSFFHVFYFSQNKN